MRKGGLSLRTPAAMLEGGDSGPALVKGNVDESLVIEQVEDGAMPPGKAEKLSGAEVATLKAWIAAGSPADGVATAEEVGRRGAGPLGLPAAEAARGRAASATRRGCATRSTPSCWPGSKRPGWASPPRPTAAR